MKAKCVYENLEFERGQDPKDAMKIGREARIQKEFMTYFDAADWAVRNLELITDGKYSPNDVIRKEGANIMPRDLSEYIQKWVKKVKLSGYSEGAENRMLQDMALLREVGTQLRKHGILVENLEFERGKDPRKSMRIGKYKDYIGKKPLEIADIVTRELSDDLEPLYDELMMLTHRKGYKSWEDYMDSIWSEDGDYYHEKEDVDIELTIRDIIDKATDIVKEKYPIKKPWRDKKYGTPEENIASSIVEANLNGAPHSTLLDQIARNIDTSLLESLEFERGKDAKDALNIGRESLVKKDFDTYVEAADWAVRNLELITDEKYSPNDIIRKKGDKDRISYIEEGLPTDLVEYFQKWADKVHVREFGKSHEKFMQTYGLMHEFGVQMKKHGILVENLDFERGQDPKDAMELGRIVKVNGDRGSGEYGVRLLDRYYGSDLLKDEEVWKARDIKTGNIVYVVKHSDFKTRTKGVWGEIDPFISGE